jgi:putative tricarboxylic transport membrane protein
MLPAGVDPLNSNIIRGEIKMVKKDEYYISILLCVFGLFVFFWSNNIPLMVAVEKSSVVNARFFPKLMGSMMVLLSFIMALENFLQRRSRMSEESGKDDAGKEEGENWGRWLGLGLICIIYYFLLQPLGFLLSSFLFMLAFLIFLGSRKWYALLFLSALVPFCLYILFKTILGAYLPEGLVYF